MDFHFGVAIYAILFIPASRETENQRHKGYWKGRVSNASASAASVSAASGAASIGAASGSNASGATSAGQVTTASKGVWPCHPP